MIFTFFSQIFLISFGLLIHSPLLSSLSSKVFLWSGCVIFPIEPFFFIECCLPLFMLFWFNPLIWTSTRSTLFDDNKAFPPPLASSLTLFFLELCLLRAAVSISLLHQPDRRLDQTFSRGRLLPASFFSDGMCCCSLLHFFSLVFFVPVRRCKPVVRFCLKPMYTSPPPPSLQDGRQFRRSLLCLPSDRVCYAPALRCI